MLSLFILTLFNILLSLGIIFWAINKNCSTCHQEMPLKRIFTLKSKCQSCEQSPFERNKP